MGGFRLGLVFKLLIVGEAAQVDPIPSEPDAVHGGHRGPKDRKLNVQEGRGNHVGGHRHVKRQFIKHPRLP